MSMSTHIVGFREPDEQWKKMKAVWDSCQAANISVPQEVQKFFNYERPDGAGVIIDLEKEKIAEEWGDDSRSGFQLDVRKLPRGLNIVRFYNGW